MIKDGTSKRTRALKLAGAAAFSYISSFVLGRSLNLPYEAVITFVLLALLLFALQRLQTAKFNFKEIFLLTGFSFLLGLAILLGNHIHVEKGYTGLLTQNYITAYTRADWLEFPFIWMGVAVLTLALYDCLRKRCPENESGDGIAEKSNIVIRPIPRKSICLMAAILFAVWLPYFLLYYPGLIFGDSMSSIRQALEMSPLDNRHPVLYTLFIKACLKIGSLFAGDDNTLGCAIYSVMQMLYMSLCFGYMISWACRRGNLKTPWRIALVLGYGLSPYIATYSIAMWKDPVFSAALMVITLELADLVLSDGKILRASKMWLLRYAVFLLIAIFSRNNGLYVVLFTEAVLAVLWFAYRRRKSHGVWRMTVGVTAAALALFAVVAGPVYDRFGIGEAPVEGMGVFLNQMARVAAYNGNMSEADRVYMDSLLPINLYPDTYRPCCTDLLKWDGHFNADALNRDFYRHWASMLVKNPQKYFESWELETYGFWTVNRPEINTSVSNISGGVPQDTSDGTSQLTEYRVRTDNLLQNESLKKYFPQDGWFVPIGIMGWCLFFMAVYLVLDRRAYLLLTLAPSVGLLLTLVIASPIFYWARYGAAVQFLIPVYFVLLDARSTRSRAVRTMV